MPERIAHDREELERNLHAAGVSPDEIKSGARALLAQARGHQLAEAREQVGIVQRHIAAMTRVSVSRIWQIEHGEVTAFDVLARYVEALGARFDLVADFGDRTYRLPVSDAGNRSLTISGQCHATFPTLA